MTILLVRHGETDGNAARILQRPDVPLNARGMRQADELARRLSAHGFAHILCSDLVRARMTAAPLAAGSGLAIEESPLLQERNFGDLRGTPYAALAEDPFGPDFTPPNGEDWPTFHARVAEAFAFIVSRRRSVNGTLVVVTHGFVCRALVERHALLPAGAVVPERFDNTSITVLHEDAPHGVSLLNCTRHLVTPLDIDRNGGPERTPRCYHRHHGDEDFAKRYVMADGTGLFEIIHTTRAMRRLKGDPVPDALINRILEAGQCAPNGANTQQWRFLVVKDPAIKQAVQVWYRRAFDEVIGPHYRSSAPPPGVDPERYRRQAAAVEYLTDHFHEAPVWIVACIEHGTQPTNRWSGASIYPAVQNMLLAARALGLGATLTTRHLIYEKETEAALGLPPGVHSYAIIPIGYPLGKFGPVKRGPLPKVVYRDRWGQAWDGA